MFRFFSLLTRIGVVVFTWCTFHVLPDVIKTANGEREMGNGEWGMGNGEWGMGNGGKFHTGKTVFENFTDELNATNIK